MIEHEGEEPEIRDAAEVGEAMTAGVEAAREIVTIANTSDMGDIRQDATGEAIRRLLVEAPQGLHGAALVETVKLLAAALAAFSDALQGRDSVAPLIGPAGACSPLDTLKALVLRNVDGLEHVIDRLGGGESETPEELLEQLDSVRLQQFRALAEHLPVGTDEAFGELRVLPREARLYDDGSPVVELIDTPPLTGRYYPRYDGDRAEFVARQKQDAQALAAGMAAHDAPAMVADLETWRAIQEDKA